MQTIISQDFNNLENGNKIIGDIELVNSKIIFKGKNNTLYTPSKKIIIANSTINFNKF